MKPIDFLVEKPVKFPVKIFRSIEKPVVLSLMVTLLWLGFVFSIGLAPAWPEIAIVFGFSFIYMWLMERSN